MTNQNELKPCPRCPKSEIDVDIDDGFSRGVQKYYVGCGACGMSSGRYKTKEEAIAAWNARPAETVPLDKKEFHSFVYGEAQITSLYKDKSHLVAGDRVFISADQLPDFIEKASKYFTQPKCQHEELDEEKVFEVLMECMYFGVFDIGDRFCIELKKIAKAICQRLHAVKNDHLLELIDGAMPVVELWNTDNIEWKKDWISKARKAIDEAKEQQ